MSTDDFLYPVCKSNYNRSISVFMFFNARSSLTLRSAAYQKAVRLYVWQAYLNDLGRGDATTKYFVPEQTRIVTAKVITRESGVLAGLSEAEWFLKKLGIRILRKKKDGSKIRKRDVILELKGRADRMLAGERTLLNLLQRMSGVATATHRLASKLPRAVKLLATRKTLWGDLDKRAVAVGGGGTHRLNLSDAVLIKENHLALTDDFFVSLKRVFKQASRYRFIEIEFEDLKQVSEFVDICKMLRLPEKMAVMLDDFRPPEVRKAVPLLQKTGALIEVSGGINEKNIKQYAIKGVSAISSGAITNKAASLDFSLNLIA